MVGAHGPTFVEECVKSIDDSVEVLVIDTGSGTVPNADVVLSGGHPTAAYRWAYENRTDVDRFAFIQDCMVALMPDPISVFRDIFPTGGGAVAWGLFPMQWDTADQAEWVRAQYPDQNDPTLGIMGPIFYTDRLSLDRLRLPDIPAHRLQAQGTERAWAFAYQQAGLPIVGPIWNHSQMQVSFNGWRKTWAGRP